jgi:hypothetical protein
MSKGQMVQAPFAPQEKEIKEARAGGLMLLVSMFYGGMELTNLKLNVIILTKEKKKMAGVGIKRSERRYMADERRGFRILICQLIGIIFGLIMGYCVYLEVHMGVGVIAGLIAGVSFMAAGMISPDERDSS